jgi:hypothetical protein
VISSLSLLVLDKMILLKNTFLAHFGTLCAQCAHDWSVVQKIVGTYLSYKSAKTITPFVGVIVIE